MTAGGSHPEGPRSRGGRAVSTVPFRQDTPGAHPDPRAHVAVLQGFVGSLMMLVGSVGTGWIANGSPMVRHPLVIALRVEGWGVYACTVLLTVGAMLLVRSWLRLGQRLQGGPAGAQRSVVLAVCAWSLPLFFAVPIFSRDVYAYVGQGRLMLAGQNPYTTGISALENWFMLGTDPTWAEARTPYGPYFLWSWPSRVRSRISPSCSSGSWPAPVSSSASCTCPGSRGCTGSTRPVRCGSRWPTRCSSSASWPARTTTR
jgi:alpha-1,6-mannosyltransferase